MVCLSESHICLLSLVSCVRFFATPWTVAHQAPLSMGFSREEHCSALPLPSLRDLPDPRTEPASLGSPALADRFFTTSATWEAHAVLSKTQLKAYLPWTTQYTAFTSSSTLLSLIVHLLLIPMVLNCSFFSHVSFPTHNFFNFQCIANSLKA